MGETSTGRVLVVDDIEENLKVLSETLIQAGYHPLQAKSGERGLQIARKAQPDLILLDIKMPGMDGFETIRQLKGDPETQGIPVIFISALNQIEDKIQGFQAGAVDYVSKPFQKEEVLARVGTHLRLRQAVRAVEEEKRKSDDLLHALLPDSIAEELKNQGVSQPRSFSDVSILFADLVDFTDKSGKMDPQTLLGELNDLVSAFDRIMEDQGCERIKTIGDAYFAVCGMPTPQPDHGYRLVNAGLAMQRWLKERNRTAVHGWEMRIGIHSGPVVAGIVGTSRYIYDVFGDTVNKASRLENASAPGRVNISGATRALLGDRIECEPRGCQPIKGAGEMEMFWVKDGS